MAVSEQDINDRNFENIKYKNHALFRRWKFEEGRKKFRGTKLQGY